MMLITMAALLIVGRGTPAERTGVFKFQEVEVSKLIDLYRSVTGAKLVIASNIAKVPYKVTLESKGPTADTETARVVQEALLKQAKVVLTRLDDGRVSVTYNDALEGPQPTAPRNPRVVF